MNAKFLFGLVVVTVSMAGSAQAAEKKNVKVVAGATALATADKADVNGMCHCPEGVSKPGYGFGAPVQHYGPPGQGFAPYTTWRNWMRAGAPGGGEQTVTPNGHPLPPRAYDLYLTNPPLN